MATGDFDKNGNPIYAGIGHVMVYIGDGKIITTNGRENGNSCDVRINPKSEVTVRIEDMQDFYSQNQRVFNGAIWTFGRIDWIQLAE